MFSNVRSALCNLWSLFYFHLVSVGTCLDEAFCNDKEDGNYRNPDTCFGYTACSGGILRKMPCPDGLMYNKDKNACDYPENTECEILEGIRGTTLHSKWHSDVELALSRFSSVFIIIVCLFVCLFYHLIDQDVSWMMSRVAYL